MDSTGLRRVGPGARGVAVCLLAALILALVGPAYAGPPAVAASIRVMGHRTQYSQQFTQQSGIEVEQVPVLEQSTMQRMAEAMVTGDGSIDLFALETSEGLQIIKDKGYYTDLSPSEVLSEALGRLYPVFARAVTNDQQQIVAWPILTMPNFGAPLDEEAQAYGVQAPRTWDEMLDLIQRMEELDFYANENYVPFGAWTYTKEDMMSYLQREYLLSIYTADGLLSFDTPIFRHLASRILHEVPREDRYPRRDENAGTLISGLNSGTLQEGMQPSIQVDPSGPHRIHAWTKVFVLNPYSSHAKEALQYLEYLATKQTAEDSALYASINQPILSPFVQAQIEADQQRLEAARVEKVSEEERQAHQQRIAALEANIRDLSQNPYLVSQRAIDEYQAFVPQLVVLEDSLIMYDDKLEQFGKQLVNGGLSLEQFIRQADDYIRIVRLERGR